MIPYSAFKKQGVEPQPGMQVNVDNMIGIIKTATGGRCLVDFNNPLSGRDVIYEVKVNKIITDDTEKIKSFIKLSLNLKEADVKVSEGKAEIKLEKEIPAEIQKMISDKLLPLVPKVKEVKFLSKESKPQEKKE
jgi:FKBP-type peptidyl-prolyl cis-trans isomerase 2